MSPEVVWTLFVLLAAVDCQLSEVFVGKGSQAVLPCRDDPLTFNRRKNPDNLVVSWTKVGVGTVWRKESTGLQFWGYRWTSKGTSRVNCPHPQYDRGKYNLEVNEVTEDDAGRYSCTLRRGGGVTERQVMLYVVKVSASPEFPVDGESVSLACAVTPDLYGASVRWTFNGTPFVPQREVRPSGGNISVVTETATMSLMGTWSCEVSYGGPKGRASSSLSVRGIVRPLTDDSSVYAAVGSEVTLPCHFSPGSTPLSPGWERLTGGLSSSLAPSLPRPSAPPRPPWDQSVVVRPRRSEDEGLYRCNGTVDGRTLSRTLRLVLAKVVPSNQKSSLLLSCQLSDASEVTGYEWVHVTVDQNGTEWAGPVREGRSLTVSREELEEGGEWICRYSGKNGLLGNVTHRPELRSFLSGGDSSSSSSSSSSTGAVVVGLIFLLLVLLLLVLAQMYRNHRRRKRILQFPALETIVHAISNQREERERHRVKE